MFAATASAWGGASINNLCILAGGAGCLLAGIFAILPWDQHRRRARLSE